MKFKSKYIPILIFIFILFSITAVSASENQSEKINADANLMQIANPHGESYLNNDLNQSILCTANKEENSLNQVQCDIENSSDRIIQADNEKENDKYSFSALYEKINQADEELNLEHDYKFNETCDQELLNILDYYELDIEKNKFTINGLNHVIDGAGTGAQFSFENKNGEITINDLTFKNFNITVLYCRGKTILNNVSFTNCFEPSLGVISVSYASLTANNCRFYQNPTIKIIKESYSSITINNTIFSGYKNEKAIEANRGQLKVFNSIFENFTSNKGSVIDFKGDYIELVNSRFANCYSETSGGAILAKYFPLNNGTAKNPSYIPSDPILIKDCIFDNLTCANDGGAIHIDLDSGSYNVPKSMNLKNTNFTNCNSRFGGAISILGGTLNIEECNFINNNASFKGGAIYSSWTNISITKSKFQKNTATKNGGAIYFDKHRLIINESNMTGNKVLEESDNAANAIYAHDVELNFSNSLFDNGGVAVYANFASDSKIENVEKNNDIFLMDNRDYILSVENKGIKLNFTKNEIIVDTLPSRFDAREWEWTTPQKIQGDNDDCWAFATVASIETALGKSTGTLFNLSQNYAQKLQLKYSDVGDLRNSLTGFSYSGLGYALSWYGVLPMDGPYDDRGMIADADKNIERIHLQDAMFIYTGMDDTVNLIKQAILKYGAVSVQSWAMKPSGEIPTEGEDIAITNHDTHFVSLIGWDDNYIDRFSKVKGGWISKDSLNGFDKFSYTNFPNIDYYAIVPQRVAIAYIFENDIDYHVNYQTDLTGLVGFDANYTQYSNEFTSKYDESIGAVGTYFNQSGINYSFDVYVNEKLMHSQNGTSEFAGFKTITLNKYIPIKTGDKFKVVFKNNALPYQAYSRQHYLENMTFVSRDGASWKDLTLENKTVCLKVYTVESEGQIISEDLVKIYKNDSQFEVNVAEANQTITFEINGANYTRVSDENGTARMNINLRPGEYVIKTSYDGTTVENTIKVLPTLIAENLVKYFRNESQFYISLIDGTGKAVPNVNITMNINGVFYNRTTNANGTAKLNINLNPGEYILTAIDPLTGLEMSYNITVHPVLTAGDVNMTYMDGTQFAATLVNGKGNALKGINITFNINGVFYNRTTDENGIARLNIRLMPGEYIITSQYENAVTSNKITITSKED